MVKAYLRYEEAAAFGLVASGEARVCFDQSGKLLLAGALEQFLVWNVKQGRCVNQLVSSGEAQRPAVTAVAPVPSSASLVSEFVGFGTTVLLNPKPLTVQVIGGKDCECSLLLCTIGLQNE